MPAELLGPCCSSHRGFPSGSFWREETFLQLWVSKMFSEWRRGCGSQESTNNQESANNQESINRRVQTTHPRSLSCPCSIAQTTLAMGYSSQAARNTEQGECSRVLLVTLTQLDSLCSAGESNFPAAALSGTSRLYQRNEISLAESGTKPVFDRRRRKWAESPLRVHPQAASQKHSS